MIYLFTFRSKSSTGNIATRKSLDKSIPTSSRVSSHKQPSPRRLNLDDDTDQKGAEESAQSSEAPDKRTNEPSCDKTVAAETSCTTQLADEEKSASEELRIDLSKTETEPESDNEEMLSMELEEVSNLFLLIVIELVNSTKIL